MPIVLRAYIDESYSDKEPQLFNISCLVANNSAWPFFEWDVRRVLECKNHQLAAQGRRQISRFHSTDFSNSVREFKDWTADEKREFASQLVPCFGKHGIHIYGYDLSLNDLVSEIPETKSDPKRFAVIILFTTLMHDICENTLRLYPDADITVHHDRGSWDGTYSETFRTFKADSSFRCRHQFGYVASESWQQCTPLQAADFLSYENYKEGMRRFETRPRRKSLEASLDLDSVSGRSQGFSIETIRKFRPVVIGAIEKKTRTGKKK